MKTSENIAEIVKALATARGEFKEIKKSKEAKIKGETAAGKPYEYTYYYADLPAIFDAVIPSLAKHGLALSQGHTGGGPEHSQVVTKLTHNSGQWIETTYPMLVKSGKYGPDMQTVAAGWTYARRQAINGILGISSDDDTDGDPDMPQGPKPQPQAPKPIKTQEPKKPIQNYALDAKLGNDGAINLYDRIGAGGSWTRDDVTIYIQSVMKTEAPELTQKQAKEFYELTKRTTFEQLMGVK